MLASPSCESHSTDANRSDWPTIPQLYVNGEFVGGCDILLSSESQCFFVTPS